MFSKKPESPVRPSLASPVNGSTFSVLGADLAIKGDVAASTDLHIDGRIEGDIACVALVQGEASEIIGGITAEVARLAGMVRGSVDVGELTIQKSARIAGDVRYRTLTIENGAVVEGRFTPGSAAESRETAGEPLLTLAV